MSGWVRDRPPADGEPYQREKLARWYASCGRTAAEIVELFNTDSLGVPRRTVSEAQVRRWAGRELAQFKLLRKATLQSEIVQEVKKMRAPDLGRWRPELAQLWNEYRRDRLPWQKIVLDECVSHIDGLRAKAHHNLCEACDQLFLATRRDARACSPKCGKWLNHEESTHNRWVSFRASLCREGDMSYVVDRIDRMEGRIADSLNQLQQTLDAVADALLDEDGPAYDEAVAEFDALLRAPEHT